MRAVTILSFLLLCSCNARMYIDQDFGSDGMALAPGESTTIRFFTNQAALDTGLSLAGGANYRFEVPLLSNWTDGHIDSNENGAPLGVTGFADSLMPTHAFSYLKRSREHRWFELMLYQDDCKSESLRGISDLPYDANSEAWTLQAICSGDLRLFVNDTQGFYINNAGFASIRITRIN